MALPIIYYGIIIINAVIFLSGKKIKIVSIASAVFLILFVMGKRYDGSFIAYDLANYSGRYENATNPNSLELGYQLINDLGNSMGLTFDQFYMALVAIIIITMLVSVIRIGGNIHLFIVSWLIYFVLISMDQLRNQSALAIMMITMLPFYHHQRRSLSRELIFLIIASLFHISFILYAIPLVLTYKKGIKEARVCFIVGIVLYAIFMLGASTSIMSTLIKIMASSSEKYEKYVGTQTNLSSLASLALYFITVFSIYLTRKIIIKKRGLFDNCVYENISMFYLFLMFSSILLPFLIVNSTFYRIVRDLSFISIAYMGINTVGKNSTFQNRLKMLILTLLISVGWFIFDIVIKNYLVDYSLYFFNNEIL